MYFLSCNSRAKFSNGKNNFIWIFCFLLNEKGRLKVFRRPECRLSVRYRVAYGYAADAANRTYWLRLKIFGFRLVRVWIPSFAGMTVV